MKRIVIVGTGVRCHVMFSKPLFADHQDSVTICGLYDENYRRAKAVSAECGNAPVFEDFDKMVDEVRPDYVLVVTSDSTHHEYIIRALEKGYDVIVEKPMTIDIEKCKLIFEAQKKSGKEIIVTFNCRFMNFYIAIKKLLEQDIIGEILNVDFKYMLNTVHGADYFRRWHRKIENSGSLLVHKSTHHFDVINWFLDEEPAEVSAFASKRFYGPTREQRGERCLTCKYKKSCEFYYNIEELEINKSLYLDTENVDGYIRDACVFSDEIDIYDTMAVNVQYEKGTTLSYSLVTYSPYEGWNLSITGTKGRLEANQFLSGSKADNPFTTIEVFDLKGNITTHRIKREFEDHGGSDSKLREMIFTGNKEDNLGHMANSYDGAKSLLIGACANISIQQKRIVNISEIINELECK